MPRKAWSCGAAPASDLRRSYGDGTCTRPRLSLRAEAALRRRVHISALKNATMRLCASLTAEAVPSGRRHTNHSFRPLTALACFGRIETTP